LAADEAPEMKINAPVSIPTLPDSKTLQALKAYSEKPVVETALRQVTPKPKETAVYQFRAWFSWLFLLILLGWIALPLTLRILSPIASGAYSLSKVLGFFVFAWTIWFFTSLKVCRFTLGTCWIWLLVFAALSGWFYWRQRKSLKSLYVQWGRSWLIQEGAFVLAFLGFTLVKIYVPHIHDPGGEGYWGGGEAGMDYGFLASVVRSETFPPQNMWMAGLPIGYTFYYGHLMMGVLTKTLGLVPAVTYNLALITLFAMIFSSAFGLAFALSGRLASGWIAGFLCAVAGNLKGAKQYLDSLHQLFTSGNLSSFGQVYDFFGPSRVIPNTINEFPYFSVLYGDMHAHTLAMPFAMLLIGILASVYLTPAFKPFDLTRDWPGLLGTGFLLGGIAFLNTWELPVWIILLGIVLLARNFAGLNANALRFGLGIVFGSVVLSATFLGWCVYLKPSLNQNALGGATNYFVLFMALGFGVSAFWLSLKSATRILSKQFLTIAMGILVALASAGVFWLPFFKDFHPQQNTVMWVIPPIRTLLRDFFSIHGLFLSVILLGFAVAYSKQIFEWVAKAKAGKNKWSLFADRGIDFLERVISPQTAIGGVMSLGLGSLAVIWTASWVHWTEPQGRMVFSLSIATVAAGLLMAALYFKKRWEFWLAEAAIILLWMSVLAIQGIHLFRDQFLTLGLGLFSVLWLLAFWNLGLALKVFADRKLSFAYIIVSFFFFVAATLEIFVMSEYFGYGEGMRNNSMFKYGIVAWTLASIGTGVFAPKVFEFLKTLFKTPKREALPARRVLTAVSAALVFVFIKILLGGFLSSINSPILFIINLIFIYGMLAWVWMEEWIPKATVVSLGVALFPFLILPFLPLAGGPASFLQRWGESLGTNFFSPLILVLALLGVCFLVWEGQRNLGRKMVFVSWNSLVALLLLMCLIYPVAATVRKCHGFLGSIRQKWVGYAESPTLNGLEYIDRDNPADAAAIRFLNDHVPGQPCLVEFVGEGYNSWGSRFSIFTGIPALMGWDGHVKEWVGARLGQDIEARFSATERIFRTLDPVEAKKYLDAYGVRLVMVGTVERHGVPGRKGGYPPEGLAKFSSFLPLIYKNPEVEIYYNPPRN
jgi:YYY domain-containing protein